MSRYILTHDEYLDDEYAIEVEDEREFDDDDDYMDGDDINLEYGGVEW